MRHQEPELHYVLEPGTVGFGSVQVPATWLQAPSRVLAEFKSQPYGFESQSEVNGFTVI